MVMRYVQSQRIRHPVAAYYTGSETFSYTVSNGSQAARGRCPFEWANMAG